MHCDLRFAGQRLGVLSGSTGTGDRDHPTAIEDKPPASKLQAGVTNVMTKDIQWLCRGSPLL